MSHREVSRTLVLLSLQRALLGEVFSSLRAVTVDWSDSMVKFWAYVDGPLAAEDEESLSCVSAEVAADFWPGEQQSGLSARKLWLGQEPLHGRDASFAVAQSRRAQRARAGRSSANTRPGWAERSEWT